MFLRSQQVAPIFRFVLIAIPAQSSHQLTVGNLGLLNGCKGGVETDTLRRLRPYKDRRSCVERRHKMLKQENSHNDQLGIFGSSPIITKQNKKLC